MNSHPFNLTLLLILFSHCLAAHATQITNAAPSLSVVQGDTASFGAQFFDVEGNAGVTISALHVLSGQTIGQFVRDDNGGNLQWTCDTTTLPAGTNPVQLVATDPAGAQTVVSFSLQISEASSIQKWRQTNFGNSLAVGAALDSADPDGDGLNNYAEFAFGLNPKSANPDIGSSVQSSAANDGQMRAIFRRRSDYLISGVSYIYEFSSDLQTWEANSVAPQILSDDGSLQNLTLDFPVLSSGQPSKFFRTRLP